MTCTSPSACRQGISVGVIARTCYHRESLVRALGTSGVDLTVEGLGGDDPACLTRLRHVPPDVVVVDLPPESIRALLEASDRHVRPAYVALLQEKDDSVGALLLQAGARGVLFPNASLEEVIHAIHEVPAGGAFCPPSVVAALLEGQRGNPARVLRLSPREAEVMELAGLGLTTKEIAARLSIERDTARNHIHNALAKLRVHSRRQALDCLRGVSSKHPIAVVPISRKQHVEG